MKEILRNYQSVVTILIVILILISILGVIPTGSNTNNYIKLSLLQRILIFFLAVLLGVINLLIQRKEHKYLKKPSLSDDYEIQFIKAQAKMLEITPEEKILGEVYFDQTKFEILNDNILKVTKGIIVSSDDNYFQAKGGVAKTILEKAGPDVVDELKRYRQYSFKQGDLIITTGGNLDLRAIIHPAVIDLDENRYPNKNIIKKIVNRSLHCALALGTKSIAFPVIGGGTASKALKPWDSILTIMTEIADFLTYKYTNNHNSLSYVALFIYDQRDITGNLDEIIERISKKS